MTIKRVLPVAGLLSSVLVSALGGPSKVVRMMHNVPHLSTGLQKRGNDFALDYESIGDIQSSSYGRSVMVLPILIGCLGLVIGLVFIFSVIARMCFKSCRFEPDADEIKGVTKKELAAWTAVHISRREKQKHLFVLFFGLSLTAIHVAYYGNTHLTVGFNSSVDSIEYLVDNFDGLNARGVSLSADGDVLEMGFRSANSSCSQVSAVQDELVNYKNSVVQYCSVVKPVSPALDDVRVQSRRYGLFWRNLSMWCIYGLVMLTLEIYVTSYFFAWSSLMALGAVVNLSVLFVLILLCVVEMVILMLSADFCMDPAKYSLNLTEPGAIRETLQHYLTCTGVSPAAPFVEDAFDYATQLNDTLTELTTNHCPGNSNLTALYSTTASIFASISDINSRLTCPPLQFELSDLLYNSFCRDTFLGLYILWISQYSTVLFLFLLCVVGSIIHHFFGSFWAVTMANMDATPSSSKRQKAVERAIEMRSSNDLDNDHSDVEEEDDDDDEGEHVHQRSHSRGNNSGELSIDRYRPLNVESRSTAEAKI